MAAIELGTIEVNAVDTVVVVETIAARVVVTDAVVIAIAVFTAASNRMTESFRCCYRGYGRC